MHIASPSYISRVEFGLREPTNSGGGGSRGAGWVHGKESCITGHCVHAAEKSSGVEQKQPPVTTTSTRSS